MNTTTASRCPIEPIRSVEGIDQWKARPESENETLSGSLGTNRADREFLQIDAETDLQAVRCFLQEYEQSSGTHRIYVRECERLLLWAWNERKKPLSSLDRQDFEAYFDFLKDPQPAEVWCGPKASKGTEHWRAFVGPLQDSALQTSVSSIKSCMEYLVDAGYLKGNPIALMRQLSRKMKGMSTRSNSASKMTEEADKVERFFDKGMWEAVNAAVQDLPQRTGKQVRQYERLRFVLSFLYLLAPRAGELETHGMTSFSTDSDGNWWWNVVGKGDKKAVIPLPNDMRDALFRYRKHLGLNAVPARDETTPLLCSLDDPPQPITARRLNQILKSVFLAAANRVENDRPDRAEKLRKASAHWGRHTAISRMDEAGIEPRLVQKSARHSDPRTTQKYIHDEGKRWHDLAQMHKMKWNESPRPEDEPHGTA